MSSTAVDIIFRNLPSIVASMLAPIYTLQLVHQSPTPNSSPPVTSILRWRHVEEENLHNDTLQKIFCRLLFIFPKPVASYLLTK